MKAFIIFLLLGLLLGIMLPLSFAQQNQISQKPNPEVVTLKIQLQTVENEKIELTAKLLDAQAKLADANAKLANTEFGKFERELRNANDRWLRDWGLFFLAILAVVGVAFWYALKSLIANGIEKRLDGFKEAVAQQEVIKNQLKVLQKEHAVSVLGHFRYYHPDHELEHREQTELLPEEAVLQVLSDKTRDLQLRYKAAEVLADRKSARLVSPALELLNSLIDDSDIPYGMEGWVRDVVNFVGQRSTEEAYQGLKKFFNRLLNDDTGLKGMLLTQTAVSLARAGIELNKRDSLSILRRSIPDLAISSQEVHAVSKLVEYFDKFDELEGIKDILTNGLTDGIPEVETRCLELLQKPDPEFVGEWKAQKETSNTQTEESS